MAILQTDRHHRRHSLVVAVIVVLCSVRDTQLHIVRYIQRGKWNDDFILEFNRNGLLHYGDAQNLLDE